MKRIVWVLLAFTTASSQVTAQATQADIFAQNKHTVVSITVSGILQATGKPDSSVGTGFFVTSSGDILTASHVVGAPGFWESEDLISGKLKRRITVHGIDQNDSQVDYGEAFVIQQNPTLDLALLKVSPINTSAVSLGSSCNLRVGDALTGIGFGSELKTSVIKALSDSQCAGRICLESSNIEEGDSGGPLFNDESEVVAIITAGNQYNNKVCAVPIDLARNILNLTALPLPRCSTGPVGPTIELGIGIGYREGDPVALGNISSDIRFVPPHVDDLNNPGLKDQNDPNNYTLLDNTVRLNLPHRKSIELRLRLFGILNLALRSSSIRASEEIEGDNLYRKTYIEPNMPGDDVGSALIYYAVRASDRQFFSRNSFSLPISVTYPLFYLRRDRRLLFRVVAGTNILLPEKITLEAENGWDRFNARQVQFHWDVGKLKEIEWFGGIGIEGILTQSTKIGVQLTLILTDYKMNDSTLASLEPDSRVRPAIRIYLSRLFPIWTKR